MIRRWCLLLGVGILGGIGTLAAVAPGALTAVRSVGVAITAVGGVAFLLVGARSRGRTVDPSRAFGAGTVCLGVGPGVALLGPILAGVPTRLELLLFTVATLNGLLFVYVGSQLLHGQKRLPVADVDG